MAAKFLMYPDSGAMNADTAQPTGTYAQLVSDVKASNFTNYYQFSGTWSTVSVTLYDATTSYLPAQVLTSATTPQPEISEVYVSDVHLLKGGFCLANGLATDEAPTINAIGASLEVLGGGRIIFDPVSDPANFYCLSSGPILLRNNVTFEGVGPASYIRNTCTATSMGACFHGNGVAQRNYFNFASYPINAVTGNDQTITLTHPLDVSNFAIGMVVLIFTTGSAGGEGSWTSGSNFQPFFSRQFRIMNIQSSTLSLDHAIPMALGSGMAPVVSLGLGGIFGTIPSKLVDRAVVRNLRLAGDNPTNGRTFSGGIYEGLIEDIWVGGGATSEESAASLWSGNGLARSLVRNIRGTFRDVAVELATGSHDSTVQNVLGSFVPGGFGGYGSGMLFGEYTANNTLENFNFSMPSFYYTGSGSPNAVFFGAGSGHRLRNGAITFGIVPGMSGPLMRGICIAAQTYQPTSDIHLDNIDITLTGQLHNVIIGSPDNCNPTGIVLRNITFGGDAPSGTNASGLFLGTTADGEIDNCDLNGPITVNVPQYGSTCFLGRIRAKVTGYAYSGAGTMADLARLDLRDMVRAGGAGFYTARVCLQAVSVAASVATATPVSTGTKTGVTGTATSGSATITGLSSFSGIFVGDVVTATAGSPVIPPGSKVIAINSSVPSVTLSNNVMMASGTSTMTFTHAQASFVLPPGQNVSAGDKIIVEVLANTTNVSSNRKKNIALVDDTGTIQSLQVATADSGPITLRMELTIESNTALSMTVTSFYPVAGIATPVVTEVHRSSGLDLAANGRVLTLQAWFDSSGGNSTITFDSVQMYAVLFGDR